MSNKEIMGISVIGSGNVGSRIGTYFSKEFNVIFYDINENVIRELNKQGYLCTTNISYALENSDVSFVSVPTPIAKNGLYDTSYLENVSKNIGNCYLYKPIGKSRGKGGKYPIFVIKSTVTPGTTEELVIKTIEEYSRKTEGEDFGVVFNPEFLSVISSTWTDNKEFCISMSNEGRIVLGEGKDKKAGDIIERLYKKLNPNIPVLRTDYKTAEMTKLVANNRLALAISYSNEIFLSCEKLKEKGINIDVDFVVNATSIDSRIGKYGSVFALAYGGPCLLKDTVVLNQYLKNKTGDFPKLVSGSIDVNNIMRKKYGTRE